VRVEDEVLQRFSVDTRQLFLRAPVGWREVGEDVFADEWGVRYTRPSTGAYYEMYEHPLAQASLEDLETYEWPDPDDPRRFELLEEDLEGLRAEGDYAVVLNGFGECIFGLPSWLRGHTQFYIDLVSNREFAEALLDRFLHHALRLVENALAVVGKAVDVVRVSDDLGTENGPIVSPEVYRRLIKPRQRMLYEAIKERTEAKILLHTCGSIAALIPDFVEIGVDAINPVQVAARGMDSRELKASFGDDIAFWGGGCDTQSVLPFGSVDDVVAEVRKRIDDLSPGGGFVFSAVHNIQFDVAPEKICAMYDTARRYGVYARGGSSG
jgi:uroporphyrinogen decarboxylase